MKPIATFTSYKEIAYRQLKTAIIRQEIQPGEQVNERALSRLLGISRTPIREALHLLECEGWIVSEACRGTWVKEITARDFNEVLEMRLALEAMAVELAVYHVTDDRRKNLQRMLESQSLAEKRPEEFTDLDIEFHLYLAEISDNRRLFSMMNGLMDVMGIYILHTIREAERYGAAASEHQAVMKAILDRDAPRARAKMTAHIHQARESICQGFQKLKSHGENAADQAVLVK